MENDKVIKVAAWIIIGSIVVPVIIGGATALISATVNGVNKARFKKKMKDGIKEGKIVEIDGKYYEVETNEEA